MTKPIRIIVADDHPVVRDGLIGECLKLSRQEVNEMSGVSGKALTMELAGIPEINKQADSAAQGMNTTGETARASG